MRHKKLIILFGLLNGFLLGLALPSGSSEASGADLNIPILSVLEQKFSQISLRTTWDNGFGREMIRQNNYNLHILNASGAWGKMDPLILKSLLLQESDCRRSVVNHYGYAGIAQIGPREAAKVGLKINSKTDERLKPEKAINACVELIKRKAMHLEVGVFSEFGRPYGDEYWKFIAASYNAGEGTISKAIRLAYSNSNSNQIKFIDLITSTSGNPQDTPLYRALPRRWRSIRKFNEIKNFALHVVERARQ